MRMSAETAGPLATVTYKNMDERLKPEHMNKLKQIRERWTPQMKERMIEIINAWPDSAYMDAYQSAYRKQLLLDLTKET